MVAGGGVSKVGTGNVIYSKGHAARPIRNTAFAHIALAVAPGSTGGRAAGAIAPVATDRGVGHWVMIGIMYGDRYGSGPLTALFGSCSIQVADVHRA